MFKEILAKILKFVYCAVAWLPEIPSPKVALGTIELLADSIVAVRYFLPLDTICELTALFVAFQALKLLLILLRSKQFRSIFSLLLGKFTSVGGLISRLCIAVLSFFGVGGDS